MIIEHSDVQITSTLSSHHGHAIDFPYSDLHTKPLHLKHAANTKLALTKLFDGKHGSVCQFKSDCMKNVALQQKLIDLLYKTFWILMQE
jgi:hypothetical protein